MKRLALKKETIRFLNNGVGDTRGEISTSSYVEATTSFTNNVETSSQG